jgi:hypothetical protein
LVKRVDVLHDVEHVIGNGRFHNLSFFKSVDYLGLFSKCKIVMVSSIGRISCPAFGMCSEKDDFLVKVAKSFQCSLNLVLKFLIVLPMQNLLQLLQVILYTPLFSNLLLLSMLLLIVLFNLLFVLSPILMFLFIFLNNLANFVVSFPVYVP